MTVINRPAADDAGPAVGIPQKRRKLATATASRSPVLVEPQPRG